MQLGSVHKLNKFYFPHRSLVQNSFCNEANRNQRNVAKKRQYSIYGRLLIIKKIYQKNFKTSKRAFRNIFLADFFLNEFIV